MRKILIIDDEKPTLAMLSLFLEALGYVVLTAENEEIGLEIFNREKPLIVLTDIKMPGKDGFSVLENIKKINPAAQVIVVTGHGDKSLESRAMDLGATRFINKPLDPDELDAALKSAEKKLDS